MSRPERSVRLVVLVAPGRPKELTARIADDLAEARLLAEGEALGDMLSKIVDHDR